MSDKAILMGDYMDLKFMRGLKVARVMIDIPIEHGERFIQMFGTPNGADPVKVAIARLTDDTDDSDDQGAQAPSTNSGPDSLPQAGSPLKPNTGVGRQDTPSPKSRSQRAAIRLQDNAFRSWLGVNEDEPDYADIVLKKLLGISSKKELDTDPAKGEAWDRLETSFRMRAYAR